MVMAKETTGWFTRELAFDDVEFEAVCRNLLEIASAHGFKCKKKTDTDTRLSLELMYGSRIIATLVGLIPYLGKHLPAGKRLFLEANIIKQERAVTVLFSITPYMELLDLEQIMPISQTIDQKATDEYFASLKLLKIIKDLFRSLNHDVPPEYLKIDFQPFAKDAFWRFLLYPLESFRSPKPVFMPTARGPMWCWGAFIIPEVWFLWHEIWGASILAFIAENIAVQILEPKLVGLPITIAAFLSVRIFTGVWGHRIYYFRYGKWLK